MKAKYLFIYIIFPCCISCNIKELFNPFKGNAEAFLNNSKWEASEIKYDFIGLCAEGMLWLNLSKSYESTQIEESISFSQLPQKEGRYNIFPSYIDNKYPTIDCNHIQITALFSSTIGGDALKDLYHVLEVDSNYVEVTEFDSKKKEIKGTFCITFVISRRGFQSTAPDTLRFTEGRFHARVR